MTDIQEKEDEIMAARTTTSQSCHSSNSSSIYNPSASQESISSDSNPDPTETLERALTQTDLSPSKSLPIHRMRTNRTDNTVFSQLPEYEIDFTDNDPSDPKNWPLWYRGMTIGFMSFATWTVVVYSTSYTSGMPGMMADFEIKNEIVATTGVTAYLMGLAAGSLLVAPISEIWGRRAVYLGSMAFFALMIIPCALAKNLQTIIVCRFFGFVLYFLIPINHC